MIFMSFLEQLNEATTKPNREKFESDFVTLKEMATSGPLKSLFIMEMSSEAFVDYKMNEKAEYLKIKS